MKSKVIQLHALPSELAAYAKMVAEQFGMSVVKIEEKPFKVERLDVSSIEQSVSKNGGDRLILVPGSINATARTLNHFFETNDDVMVIDIGVIDDNIVRESAISFKYYIDENTKILKKSEKSLRGITYSGVNGVNSRTGLRAFYKSHRFTTGALRAFEQGLILAALGEVTHMQPVKPT